MNKLKTPFHLKFLRLIGRLSQSLVTIIILRGDLKKFRFYRGLFPEYTQLTYIRLQFLSDALTKVTGAGLKGAIVQCGVWKGGSAVALAQRAQELGLKNKIWLFDSFEGMPEAGPLDKEISAKDWIGKTGTASRLIPVGLNVADLKEVRNLLFEKYAFPEDIFVIVKGWFQEALPPRRSEIGPISLLHIDADWHDSVLCCLENLYDNVESGGIIVIDDYSSFSGAAIATDNYLQQRGIAVSLIAIDDTAAYFIKP